MKNLKMGNSEQEKTVKGQVREEHLKNTILKRKHLKKSSSVKEESEKGQFGRGTI